MKLSPREVKFAGKLSAMIKRHAKRKTSPSGADLIKLAKVLDPNVSDLASASKLFASRGTLMLTEQGILEQGEASRVISNLAKDASSFTNFQDFASSAICSIPGIPQEVQLMAAAILSGDDDDDDE